MLGSGELVIIFLVILLLFGGKKLPELARSLGLGIREFKKASQEEMEEIEKPTASAQSLNIHPVLENKDSNRSNE